jgi:hypothetical protein
VGLRLQQVAGKIRGTPDLLISSRFAPGAEAEQGLERSHRLPPAIVAKDEFIEIKPGADRGSRHDRFRSATAAALRYTTASGLLKQPDKQKLTRYNCCAIN